MKKLRNKKTGEIGELQITAKHYAVVVGNGTASCNAKIYCSLDKLNAEWEDYEEPKDFYYITNYGCVVKDNDTITKDFADDLESIGNYFETEEEAEKAVEKLKAWKRLKDKGFRFIGKTYETDKRFGSIFYKVDEDTYSEDIINELELLFSQEDD